MKFITVGISALVFVAASAHAFIEVTAEIVPYREKRDPAEPPPGTIGTREATPPVPVRAIPTKPANGGENQEKMMSIRVRNASKRMENELVVRYWFIGRDMKTMKPLLMDCGEESADLKPNAIVNLTTGAVKSSVSRTMAAPGKAVQVTGVKLVGYAVQVIKGGRVVGDAYQEQVYKKLIGSEGKTPGPFFKPGPPEGESQ